ncbi:glycosyltransferase family 4 protein [Deinococcus sp. Arct2-2]|uniref:glycosyltransferase family 4 protein n=1 Tax=Deinococcus sp. Arct2-2 TaxID=2568653 RepID=UPI0010A3E365|nr:glycosyltransferase family 4 protein [Deinococcus sp. Arct2-2]THF69519.1 glycosyltransferase family 4 protein [Deinococcus sp. Arct2-2]
MNLRVLALSPYPLAGPSPRYRLYAYQKPLRDRGIDLDIQPFLPPLAFQLRMNGAKNHPVVLAQVGAAAFKRLLQARTAQSRYDLIYVHRQTAPFAQAYFDKAFLRSKLPIVFDMDDAVFTEYSIDLLLRGSVAATVGNSYLSSYVNLISPSTHVAVIPTVVDTMKYRVKDQQRQNARPVVGWIGTSSTFENYLLPFLPGLISVCKRLNAEFHVIASLDVQARAEAVGAKFIPWSLDTELRNLQDFDIGVMPLREDSYVRGKCAFKLIEYGAIGIPSIGSDIGANREVLKHGITGLLASNQEEFETHLVTLLTRPDLGRPLGLAARRIIEQRFSLAAQIDVMETVIRDAVKWKTI